AIPAAPEVRRPKIEFAPVKPIRLTQIDQVQLPRVYWAWPSVGEEDPDSPALDLLASVLAGGEASRMYDRFVLQEGWATDISANNDTKENAGLFVIEATAAEERQVKVIEQGLAEEIKAIQSEPPTDEELTRSLATLEKLVVSSLTPPLNRAITLSTGYVQKNDPRYYREEIARYYRVKPADLQRVASKYLTPDKVVLEVRPPKEGEKESEAAAAGPAATTAESAPELRTPSAAPAEWSRLPGASEPVTFQPPKITRAKLTNGADVWSVSWKTLPIVSVRILFPAGTADDPAGKSGLATLTASVLDKGTTSKTALEFASRLELLGATTSVSATSDTTSVGFTVVKRNLAPAMKLVGEMLASPRFDGDDFSRQRELQLADLVQGPDNPSWTVGRVFRTLMFGEKHPYGNPPEGYSATVSKLTVDDVREFHRERLNANHATLVIVGDVDEGTLPEVLEESLAGWNSKGAGPAARPAVDESAVGEPGVLYLIDKPGAVQSFLCVGRRWAQRGDPRYYAALLGNRILGGDFMARINANLRERNGYTYGAYSAVSYNRAGSVWAARSPVRADATGAALKELLGEMDAVAKEKVFTPDEIDVNRAAEIRSFPESFEAPASIGGVVEEMARFGLPLDYLESYLVHLQTTPPERLQQVIGEVVDPERRVVLVVGDAKNIEPQLAKIAWKRPFKEIRLLTTDGRPTGETLNDPAKADEPPKK
ncbi:MAG: M16 family metallopeptidase, partial [Planctomycetia bacterium]